MQIKLRYEYKLQPKTERLFLYLLQFIIKSTVSGK